MRAKTITCKNHNNIKRYDRVSALKCMRETNVSIREPASCEHLRLSDFNND